MSWQVVSAALLIEAERLINDSIHWTRGWLVGNLLRTLFGCRPETEAFRETSSRRRGSFQDSVALIQEGGFIGR